MTVAQLERKAEKLRENLDVARSTGRVLRQAKGPWAATNRKANQRLQNRLTREISETSRALFKAKMVERLAREEM